MKKYIIPLFMFIFSFILVGNVNAKNVILNFDSNEKFNYFYEMKNNTNFYNFLLGKGVNLFDYLGSYSNKSYDIKYNRLFIFYLSELSGNLINIPDKSYYMIYVCSNSVSSKVFYQGDNYYYGSESGLGLSGEFFFFDIDGNYLSYGSSSYYMKSFDSNIYKDLFDFSNNTDFSYFLSKYYMGGDLSYGSSVLMTDIVVTDFIIDNKTFIIDDNKNYSNFLIFFRNLFTKSEKFDVNNTNFQYFKDYKIISSDKKLVCLYNTMNYKINNKISVPDNYVSHEIYYNSSFLIPKIKNNSFVPPVYISSTGFPEVFLSYWDITFADNNYSISYLGNNKRIKKSFKTFGTIGTINLLEKEEYTPNNYYDYIYQFGYHTDNSYYDYPLKYSMTIYYNPEYFDVVDYSVNGVSGVFPGTDIPFTLTKEIIESGNYSGESNLITEPIGDGSGSDYMDWIGGINNERGETSFDISTITYYATDIFQKFFKVIKTIFVLVFSLFNILPVELQQLFYFSFIGGIILLFYKILRG